MGCCQRRRYGTERLRSQVRAGMSWIRVVFILLAGLGAASFGGDVAALSGFANAKMADYIDNAIEQDLKVPGAEEMTAKYRAGPRKTVFEGGTYMRPTIVL